VYKRQGVNMKCYYGCSVPGFQRLVQI
jgi:hypothetical protein